MAAALFSVAALCLATGVSLVIIHVLTLALLRKKPSRFDILPTDDNFYAKYCLLLSQELFDREIERAYRIFDKDAYSSVKFIESGVPRVLAKASGEGHLYLMAQAFRKDGRMSRVDLLEPRVNAAIWSLAELGVLGVLRLNATDGSHILIKYVKYFDNERDLKPWSVHRRCKTDSSLGIVDLEKWQTYCRGFAMNLRGGLELHCQNIEVDDFLYFSDWIQGK
ncbi:hypothetical protein DM02DRAFT_658888 [Periconia macrospinosa]|uniref:Uncharacterized protein n=1 Tax=Periconia macrospinosa TaxID=97972 RepID=A0A2V1DFA1_9PLEO|nr:hypothetical protein DM02DRAFT_658888 [Periconia macrospinosa]